MSRRPPRSAARCRATARSLAIAWITLGWIPIGPAGVLAQGADRFARVDGPHEVRVEKSIMVPMRDGVRLATDLYLPADLADAGERLPTILLRTPYNKETYNLGAIQPARWFASHGYAAVVQDTRGKWQSEGDYLVSAADRLDGFDTVGWASSQPWSTGKVGTYGCSYLGENQMQLSAMRHPNHTAALAQAAGGSVGSAGDRYGYFGVFEGGAFSLSASFGWFRFAGAKTPGGPDAPRVDVTQSLRVLPTYGMMERFGPPGVETDYEEFISTPLTDPWWDRLGYIRDDDRFDVPALHVNSWYDLGAAETLQLWTLMRENAESSRGRDHQYVIMSPAVHCASERASANTVIGELDLGDARLEYWDVYLRWFDHWLKGEENGVTGMPKLQLYVMGRNEWRGEDQWPLARTEFTPWYLHSGGMANTRGGDGFLLTVPQKSQPADWFQYDPGDPVPSRGGSVCCTGNPEDQPGAFDQGDIEDREDVLIYTSERMGEDGMEITGPVRAILYVSSDARDTDFTVKLVDVFPDDRAFNIQEGILRARYREGYDEPAFMEPDEVYEIEIDLHATAYWFAPGHRIRIEVSSSNFPRFDRNLNTGGNNYDEAEWVIAENGIHHSPEYPSRIILPVIPTP